MATMALGPGSGAREKAMTEMACGSKELYRPLSRFPLRGKGRGGRVPPTPRHAPRQHTTLARIVLRLPPQEGFQNAIAEIPLAHPPIRLRQQGIGLARRR